MRFGDGCLIVLSICILRGITPAHARGFHADDKAEGGEKKPRAEAPPAKLPPIPKLSNETLTDLFKCRDLMRTSQYEVTGKTKYDDDNPGNLGARKWRDNAYTLHPDLLLSYEINHEDHRGFLLRDGTKTYFVARPKDTNGQLLLKDHQPVHIRAEKISHEYPRNNQEITPDADWLKGDDKFEELHPVLVKDDDKQAVRGLKARLFLQVSEIIDGIKLAIDTLKDKERIARLKTTDGYEEWRDWAEEYLWSYGEPERMVAKLKACQAALDPKELGPVIDRLTKNDRWSPLYKSIVKVRAFQNEIEKERNSREEK